MYSGGSRNYNYREQFQDAFQNSGVTEFVHHDYFSDIGHTAMQLAALSTLLQRFEEWTLELDAVCRRTAAEPIR